jgi:hypothetical protein
MKLFLGNGFFVDQLTQNGELTIGGLNNLKGANSPNSGLPLTQLAKIQVTQSGFHLPDWEFPWIHFFYSWKCKIHEDDFSYQYSSDSIHIIEYCSGIDDYSGFPYENYPESFPEIRLSLKELTSEEQSVIAQLNQENEMSIFDNPNPEFIRLSIPAHQFGGVPFLLSPESSNKNCPVCYQNMVLIATIGNESYSNNEGLSGNDFVQIIYWACLTCKVISAKNFCD